MAAPKKTAPRKAPAKRAPAKAPKRKAPAPAKAATPPAASFTEAPPAPPVPPAAPAAAWAAAPGQAPPAAAWAPVPSPPPPARPRMQPSEERQYAMLLHLSALAGLLLGGFFFVGPLIMWLLKKDESAFVDRHGRAALDFSISLVLYGVVLAILFAAFVVATLGFGLLLLFPVLVLVAIAGFVLVILLPILAAMKANQGQEAHYPLAIPFLSGKAAAAYPPAPPAPPTPPAPPPGAPPGPPGGP